MKTKRDFTMNREQFEKKYNINLDDIVWVDKDCDSGGLIFNYSEDKFIAFGCNDNRIINHTITKSFYENILEILKQTFVDCSNKSWNDYFFINTDKMRYIFYNDCKTEIYTFEGGYDNNFFKKNDELEEKYKYFYDKNGMYIYFNDYNDFEFKLDEDDNFIIYSVIEKEDLSAIFYWEDDHIKDFQKDIEIIKIKKNINNF